MKKIEIPLTSLLTALLRSWWLVVLCALLAGGFFYLNTGKGDPAAEAAYQKALAGHEAAVAAHQQQVAVAKADMERLQALQTSYHVFLAESDSTVTNSLKMGLSPQQAQAAFLYAAASGEQGGKAVDLAVLDAQTLPLAQTLGDTFPEGLAEWQLKELLSARREGDLLALRLYVPSSPQMDAPAMLTRVFEALKDRQKALGLGELTVLRAGQGPVDAVQLSGEKLSAINTYRAIMDRTNDVNSWLASAKAAYEKAVAAAPAMPAAPAASDAKRAALQGAAQGAALGALLALGAYFIVLPMQEKRQLRRMLNIPFLGSLNDENGLALCLAGVEAAAQGKREILLTGSRIALKDAEKTAERLNAAQQALRFTAAENVEKSAEAVKRLAASDAVVLMEKVNLSTLRGVNSQMERIADTAVPVIGYMVY